MKSRLISEVETTFNDLYDKLNSFSQQELNEVPFEGSWTAGQVAEHIFKSTGGLPVFFNGRTGKIQRPFDMNVAQIDAIFLDFTTKMKSPEFILPTENFYRKEDLLKTAEIIRNEITELTRHHELSDLCLDFEFPGTGHLTKYEWLRFAFAHTKRHTWQIGNILSAIKKTETK